MKKYLLILIMTLGACSLTNNSSDFEYKEIKTSKFKIASWQKISDEYSPFKVYIEGDGHVFYPSGIISSDPTPRDTFWRDIAFSDPHPNVIYLARPCQYVTDDAECHHKYWSSARFSPEVIQSEYEAIYRSTLNNPVTLVGYSGGAQVAGLVAVKYPQLKINKLVTYAGNLDIDSWVKYHNFTPLILSENLGKYKKEYLKIPQVHYVGEYDENVVPEITEKFISGKHLITKIKNASHNRITDNSYLMIQYE